MHSITLQLSTEAQQVTQVLSQNASHKHKMQATKFTYLMPINYLTNIASTGETLQVQYTHFISTIWHVVASYCYRIMIFNESGEHNKAVEPSVLQTFSL